jgi:hypothetical protein
MKRINNINNKLNNNKTMNSVKLLVCIVLLFTYGNASAQFSNRINQAVQRGAERAVERKAEEKAEQEAEKGLDKAERELDRGAAEAEKGLTKLADTIEEAQKAQEEADAKTANLIGEVPEVGSTPYTPSESEFAFFAMKKGAVQVFASKDAKGKVTGQTRTTIKEITGTSNAFAVAYQSEMLDAKGQPTDKKNPLIINYRIVVKDGVMYLDMKGMFGAMDGLDGMQVSGTTMRIPTNLAPGQTLGDAAARVRIGFINCSALITEGKCEAIEDVTVEAGNFHCFKVSQKVNVTAMGIRNEGTTLTWYAKGAGAVKTESYDKNGKLQSVQELILNN